MNFYDSGADIAHAFFDRWNRGDAEAVAELFIEDADFVNVVGYWWKTRRQIQKAHEYGFRRIFQHAVVEIIELKARELTPDIHIVHTVSTLKGQSSISAEKTETRIAVISMVAVRQQEKGFRIVSCHNTDRVEGADTHIRTGSGFNPVSYA